MVTHTDVTVIGAGIAGLSAAVACQQRGLRVAIVERGPDVASRDRENASDIASGVGGAGLFSDGKFSFFPSATELWKLEPKSDLQRAYQWFSEIIRVDTVEAPPFPEVATPDGPTAVGQHAEKRYQSYYMPLAARLGMVAALAAEVGAALHTSVSFLTMSLGETCTIQCMRGTDLELFESRAVIGATGRLGPLLLQDLLPSELQTFRRLEIGVRIEQPAGVFFFEMPRPWIQNIFGVIRRMAESGEPFAAAVRVKLWR
jgi:flavin-dependent dehydrogenase